MIGYLVVWPTLVVAGAVYDIVGLYEGVARDEREAIVSCFGTRVLLRPGEDVRTGLSRVMEDKKGEL